MTRIKWQQKPYTQSYNTSTNIMKNEFLIFIQNVRGASATRSLFFLLLDMRFWYLRWMLTITVLLFLQQFPWYWRTLETFGTGLMHNINKRKQTSQWFTNQTEDIIVSYDLTYNIPPHALHNSLEFSYITYMLHSLISYFTDIKANISQCKV